MAKIENRSVASRFAVSQASMCKVCDKRVYEMEKITADQVSFHKTCFRCTHCKRVLSLGNYSAIGGQYYCKPHFISLFKTKGNYSEGFGFEKRDNPLASTLQKPKIESTKPNIEIDSPANVQTSRDEQFSTHAPHRTDTHTPVNDNIHAAIDNNGYNKTNDHAKLKDQNAEKLDKFNLKFDDEYDAELGIKIKKLDEKLEDNESDNKPGDKVIKRVDKGDKRNDRRVGGITERGFHDRKGGKYDANEISAIRDTKDGDDINDNLLGIGNNNIKNGIINVNLDENCIKDKDGGISSKGIEDRDGIKDIDDRDDVKGSNNDKNIIFSKGAITSYAMETLHIKTSNNDDDDGDDDEGGEDDIVDSDDAAKETADSFKDYNRQNKYITPIVDNNNKNTNSNNINNNNNNNNNINFININKPKPEKRIAIVRDDSLVGDNKKVQKRVFQNRFSMFDKEVDYTDINKNDNNEFRDNKKDGYNNKNNNNKNKIEFNNKNNEKFKNNNSEFNNKNNEKFNNNNDNNNNNGFINTNKTANNTFKPTDKNYNYDGEKSEGPKDGRNEGIDEGGREYQSFKSTNLHRYHGDVDDNNNNISGGNENFSVNSNDIDNENNNIGNNKKINNDEEVGDTVNKVNEDFNNNNNKNKVNEETNNNINTNKNIIENKNYEKNIKDENNNKNNRNNINSNVVKRVVKRGKRTDELIKRFSCFPQTQDNSAPSSYEKRFSVYINKKNDEDESINSNNNNKQNENFDINNNLQQHKRQEVSKHTNKFTDTTKDTITYTKMDNETDTCTNTDRYIDTETNIKRGFPARGSTRRLLERFKSMMEESDAADNLP